MKASRLLSILMLLQAHGRMTAPALARALEVSPRTILRDVDQLSAAGVPLWGEPGRFGGFQLREGWSTTLTGMTEPESQALLLAGLPGAATDLGLGAAAASARLKMVASLPAEWREQADRVGARLHIDPVDWYRSQETPAHLREVAEAVWNSRRIALRYESWRGQAERELEPLGLVLKAGTWYMAARSQGQTEVRTYRLAAVRALRTLTTRFRRPAGFDLAHYWQASAARFEAELQRLQARVRVSPRAMGWLVNARTPFARVDDDAAAPGAGREGWVCVLLPIESIEHGARRLLSYGAEVEVLAPAALRQHLQGELAATRALYANGGSGAVAI
ncbi:MAG TPA: YafY family transcriptional regulator [Hydrogenophaga sp.]|uniref:helix-turn-helix transcriptional regulator n=1 Tax=Hydrogenophaga sp. TaxID=1904254 RepID=UPI0008C4E25F|nr:YafY family protein [Hydrogenophaga sp.]OGA74732.1 MAG: transcriptional regulator [Burkholderiales bacterium GWE1_65_30]OGA91809.1 MAG: transcriptional regulator [Burkholderiales bacterium GWF1_66_17]HAX20826.1 YafY family transcriptional regulator [Hydrogenophaga sp.]HBU20552.1 YafY family transcriptional regulator [Hydrogenophaga sp.]